MVEERERGGGWRSLGDLAGRSGAFAETLGRLAWAGACDELVDGAEESRRRRALWELGVAVPGNSVPEGTQLALPLEPHEGPELRALSAWERMLADYGSTGITLREHPLELMRPSLPGDLRTSEELERHPDGRRVRVAGLVVARQRPATAKGVTFMLLEDEHGTVNLIIPPPVYERFRLAVRSEPLLLATGRLERREGTMNVVVDRIERLERPDLPRAEIKHIEPRRSWSTETQEEADLRAVVPVANSFGRRGTGAAGPSPAATSSSQAHHPTPPSPPAGRSPSTALEYAQSDRHHSPVMSGRIVVGTSSWADPGFVKEWYPPKLPAKERLPFYSQRFEAVELNSSFYAIPDRNVVRGWVDATPDDFIFDVKVHRALSRHSARSTPCPRTCATT